MGDEYQGRERCKREQDLEDLIRKAVASGATEVAQRVVSETVPIVIKETLKNLGINADNPLQVQKNMQYVRDSAQRSADPEVINDREFLRKTRLRCEGFWNKFYDTLFGALTRWFMLLIALGLFAWFGLNHDAVDAVKGIVK